MPSDQHSHGPAPERDEAGPGPEHAPERQSSDFDYDLQVEVSDLPQPPRRWFARIPEPPASSAGYAHWYKRRMLVPLPLIAAALAALLTLALLTTPIGPALGALVSRPRPAPTTAARVSNGLIATPAPPSYPTPTLIVPALGSIPSNCPPESLLVTIDSAIAPSVGGQGVWLTAGFVEAHGVAPQQRAIIAMGRLSPSVYTAFGWPVQILVAVKQGLTQPITITGRDLRTDYPLWLSASPGDGAMPTVAIDPNQLPSRSSDGQWLLWFGVLYLPGAGCYMLQSTWPSGGWTATFAAGR